MTETQPPRLLIVEDDPDTSALIYEVMSDHFGPDCLTLVHTVADAASMDPFEFDLVLSDMNLPDGKGLELLEFLLKCRPDLPVVMVTTENVMDTAARAISMGAYDYVVKAGDYLFTLPLVVEKNLALWRTQEENKRLQFQLHEKNKQLEEIASTDALTGLANRRAFVLELERVFADANRHGRDLALAMIDLDGFKQLNDTLGHPFGDRILQQSAKVLLANCRQSDLAGRLGGDEFVLLLPRTDMQTAVGVAQRVLDEFAVMAQNETAREGYDGTLTMSVGLTSILEGGAGNAETLVKQADEVLYAAKRAGKGRLMAFPEGLQMAG